MAARKRHSLEAMSASLIEVHMCPSCNAPEFELLLHRADIQQLDINKIEHEFNEACCRNGHHLPAILTKGLIAPVEIMRHQHPLNLREKLR